MKTKRDLYRFDQIGKFSNFDQAYAAQPARFADFVTHLPTLEGLDAAIDLRTRTSVNRQLLYERLFIQMKMLRADTASFESLAALLEPDTFTITTAHQPVIAGGPLYVVYKALSVIHLCRQMAERHPDKKFIPVFVLGAEDHDFDEISHTRLFGQTLHWQTQVQGPVGLLSTDSLKTFLEQFDALLADRIVHQEIVDRIKSAYSTHFLYGDAAQQVLHDIFSPLGMLVIQMNDSELKRSFIPAMETELFEQPSAALVEETQCGLERMGFKSQAFARPINLFYMMPGLRARIEQTNGVYYVAGTDISWTAQELKLELYTRPERFSPNVVMRPLYQEWVLPNIAYVGGGGELAYWMERKSHFSYFGVPFPVLVRRSSALWLTAGDVVKLTKLGTDTIELALPTSQLIKQLLTRFNGEPYDLKEQHAALDRLAEQLAHKTLAVDPTLERSAYAEVSRMRAILEQFANKLNKALKTKHETSIRQVLSLQERLYPSGGLQERTDNLFGPLLQYGHSWLETILPHMNPLETQFKVIREVADH